MHPKPVSIVTGAATGIGFSIAKKLLEKNHALVLNDIDSVALADCVQRLGIECLEMESEPVSVVSVAGDASSLDVIDSLISAAQNQFGRVDHVVANAGITTFGQFLDYEAEQLERLLSLNIRGSFFIAQRVAKALIASGRGGRILFMSSVTGYQYHPDLAAYGMTKAALRMLARSLGAELAAHGITVNCIAPGATATERTEQDADYTSTWDSLTPTGRVSTPEDIAATASFLLSDEAAQITGQTIVVDGGWTLVSPT